MYSTVESSFWTNRQESRKRILKVPKRENGKYQPSTYTNVFFGSALKLTIQIGTLSIDNLVRNISRLGTFNIFS